MFSFKSFIRKRREGPDEFVIQPEGNLAWWVDSRLSEEIVRTVANQVVAEYGQEIIESIVGGDELIDAVKQRVVNQIMGNPRDYRR